MSYTRKEVEEHNRQMLRQSWDMQEKEDEVYAPKITEKILSAVYNIL